MKTIKPILEISFEEKGGAEYFFSDIDGDGKPEIITYQGPGVFGSEIFKRSKHIEDVFPKSVSVSAFRFDGTCLWTWGDPNPSDKPYISHAYESCVTTGDIDGDGLVEVVIADGDRVIVLDGKTGSEKAIGTLPEDNFYIIQVVGESTEKNQAAIVIKNGETGYRKWCYGEPVIGLNSKLEPVWEPKAIPGGGHHILAMDLNNDGRKEYLIGYCAVGLDGEVLWTVDSVNPSLLDAVGEHVDYTDIICKQNGEKLLAMAGSNKLYLVEKNGKTIFSVPGSHVQGSAIGHFRSDSEFQVALYNAPDGPMVLYDPSGKKIWSQSTLRNWPLGMPACCENRRFHRNRPIVTLFGKEQDWIGFADGGWPWAMDGNGEVNLKFQPPENSCQVEPEVPLSAALRGDDIGYGFALQSLDIDNDGEKEAIIYNRNFLWAYKIS